MFYIVMRHHSCLYSLTAFVKHVITYHPWLVACFRYKNGREIEAGDRYTMTYENAEASLTIRDTESSDSAVYMCSASNKLGTVDSSASLTIHGQFLYISAPLSDTCLHIFLSLYCTLYIGRQSVFQTVSPVNSSKC